MIEKCHFSICKTWTQRAEVSFMNSHGFTLMKQELLVGNNIVTVYYSHNEGIIIIGYNGNFPLSIEGCLAYGF